MLTLILETQEGDQIELSVQPEDTFADLKSQYSGTDIFGLSDSLQQLITNGASVADNTRIFDYVTTGAAHEWFDAARIRESDVSRPTETTETTETKMKERQAPSCGTLESSVSAKQFFPSSVDDRIPSALSDEMEGTDVKEDIDFPSDDQPSREKPFFLSPRSALSLLKPKNSRPRQDEIISKKEVKLESDEFVERVNSIVSEDFILELSDTVDDFKHPGVLCRLCGESTANPIYLYAQNHDNNYELSLADKINLCLPVTVTVTDPLPKQICEDCQEKLNASHQLSLSSLETEDKLTLLLRENKLCVNDTSQQQCPLCLEGNVRSIDKSGIYRKDTFKNETKSLDSDNISGESPVDRASPEIPFEFHENVENFPEIKTTKETKIAEKKQRIPEYNCFTCDKKFQRKITLEKHISSRHAESVENASKLDECYKCKTCNEAFADENEAKSHIIARHPADSSNGSEQLNIASVYACEFCDRCFTIPSSLHEHRDTEHDKNLQYSCGTCRAIFDSRRKLANHKNAHSHRNPFDDLAIRQLYVCKYCNKTLLHHSSLSSHVNQRHVETSLQPYLCRLCNTNFDSYRQVAHHRDIVHPYESTLHERSSSLYRCQFCHKEFSHELALIKHIRMHTGERPYKCLICAKGFSQSSGLYTHLKIHSDLRPYGCPKCPRTFKIKGDRDNHVKKHSGNRPYKCEYCSKAFMTQHVYSQHRRIHTNDRPYKCDICGQAFRRSHVLTVHTRRHTGEKPHNCDICPKTYRQRSDLVKHKKVQHGIASASTAVADDSFSKSSTISIV